jgi:hypothetical protein
VGTEGSGRNGFAPSYCFRVRASTRRRQARLAIAADPSAEWTVPDLINHGVRKSFEAVFGLDGDT